MQLGQVALSVGLLLVSHQARCIRRAMAMLCQAPASLS